MNDADAIDLMLERAEREEREKLERERGQHILDMAADHRSVKDPFTDTLRRAYQAKADADKE
jgi:hypothetical protein